VLALSAAAAAVVINEVMPNPEDYSDAEWVEIFSDETLNLSGWKLDTTGQVYAFQNIIIEDYLVVAKNKTSFSILWPSVNESKIIAWSGLGLNNGGESLYLFNDSDPIYNTTYPSFSSKAGNSWSMLENKTFVVCDAPTPGAPNSCAQSQEDEDETQDDEADERQTESEIKITDAPNDARFGESIDVEIDVYKGDTSKYAVYVYVENGEGEKVSEKITEHVHEKFSRDAIEVEIDLKCMDESGDYAIVAEGLGEEDREEISISSCEEGEEEIPETQEQQAYDENIIEETQKESEGQNYLPLSSNAVLETKSFSLKSAMPYFLATLCALVAIYLLVKKI
jgi:hypothetical protein